MLKKGLPFFLALLVSMLFFNLNLSAQERQVIAPKISIIKDIEVIIVQGTAFKLPTTVDAILSNKKTTKVSIKWDKTVPNTNKIGVYTFKGTVKGYTPKVALTVKITPSITSINDISISILCNSKYTLPSRIPAIFSDNSNGTVPIIWKPINVDYSKVGNYIFEGSVVGYKRTIKLTLDTKSKYKNVNNINETIKHNQSYTLPKTVKAALFDDTISDVSITWSQSSVDTSKIGSYVIEGVVEGYPDKVYFKYNVIPTIISISNKNITMTKGDIYYLPNSIEANMSDGSIQQVNVSWTPNELDLNKIGITEINGKVDSYEKEIKWSINIRTDFNLMSRAVNYTQWGYIPIGFSKNIVPCTNLDNIILKDENGIQIRILKAIPGTTEKGCLLIIPMRNLDKNITYTLIILKNTIQAENGEYFPDEISFTFKVNN